MARREHAGIVEGFSGDLHADREAVRQEAAAERQRRLADLDGMPRVELIDGLSVGFKQLSSVDLGRTSSESAYLVMWRQHDRLIGFVFRSRRDVALADLVREAPRLVALVRSVL